MKKAIKEKIFQIITAIMVIIYIGLGIYGVFNAKRLNELYEQSYKKSISVGSATVELYGEFLDVESSLKEALYVQKEEQIRNALNQVNEDGLKIQNIFSEIKAVSADKFDKSSGLLQDILKEFQQYEIAKDETYEMLNDGKLIKCKNNIRLILLPIINAITDDLKTFVDAENEDVKASYVEYRNVTEYIQFQTWVGIILLILFIIYATVYSLRKMKELREKDFIKKEEFRITIDNIVEGVMILNTELNVVKINKFAEQLTGWVSKKANGQSMEKVFNVVNETTFVSMKEKIRIMIQSERTGEKEQSGILYSKNNDQRIVAFNNSQIKDIYGQIIGYVVIFRDITERRMKEKEIYYMTYHDQVTHIYNRTYFEEQKKKLSHLTHYPISVIQGDINGLKLINDAFGHLKGDELLMNAAKVLKKHCRENDVVCRTGGDEFTILLPNTTYEEMNQIIADIEDEVQQIKKSAGNSTFFISIALGGETVRDNDECIDDVIKRADEHMYKKKLLEKDSLHSALLKSIKTTLEEKSYETEAHATRLIGLSKKLGQALQLTKDKLYELELLSNLHDIGKIAIPNHILNKNGPLTDDEWLEMKKHPEIGYRIAHSTTELEGIAEYILYHHERWDGKGYPQGLTANNIPLLARIISVVDAYDAMTDDRVYSKGISKEAALAEIERNAGTQFDPNIAKLFIQIMDN